MNFVADNNIIANAHNICVMPSAPASQYRGSEKDWFSTASCKESCSS